jgi:hypothetical protein
MTIGSIFIALRKASELHFKRKRNASDCDAENVPSRALETPPHRWNRSIHLGEKAHREKEQKSIYYSGKSH